MTSVEPAPERTAPPPSGSFPNAWTLWRVRGVPIRMDRSWLLIGAYVAFLYFQQLRDVLFGANVVVLIALAALCSVLFFFSILGHELGHALTSLDRDIPVSSITMWGLGGVTESTREARRARDEFVIVGIGPFISLVLAAAFGLVATVTSAIPAVAAVAGFLGWTNLVLAVFNIVPGYPLDGGRLLRSIFWGVTGKAHQSTRWAARVGQVFAGLLIAYVLFGYVMSGGGSGFGGLWNVLIGLFLFRGATASHQRARMREQLERVRVADVMGSVPPTLAAGMVLREAIEQVQQRPSLLWPVGDPLRGTLLLAQIDAVPADRWDTTTVADVALDPATSSVEVDTALDDVLDLMGNAPQHMLVVTDRGRAVGLLTPSLLSQSA